MGALQVPNFVRVLSVVVRRCAPIGVLVQCLGLLSMYAERMCERSPEGNLSA